MTDRCIHDHRVLDMHAGHCLACEAEADAQAAEEARAARLLRRAETRLRAVRDAHALATRSEQLAADLVAGRIAGAEYTAATGGILRLLAGEEGIGRENPDYQAALVAAWDAHGQRAGA